MKNTIKIFTGTCAIIGMCAGCNNGADSSMKNITEGFDFNYLPSEMKSDSGTTGGYAFVDGVISIDIDNLKESGRYEPHLYNSMQLFNDGLAYVGFEKNPGFINNRGEMIVDLSDYDTDGLTKYFSEGLVLVNLDNQSFVALDKKGEIVWEAEGHVCTQLRGGYAIYTPHHNNTSNFGVINSKGEIVLDAEGDDHLNNGSLYLFCFPAGYSHPSIFPVYDDSSFKYFVNVATGEHILEDAVPEHENEGGFGILLGLSIDGNNLVTLKTKEGYGLINLKGEWVVEPQYQKLTYDGKWYVIKENGKWGWINEKGEEMIPAEIESSETPCFGISELCRINDHCFIDRKGEIALETDYIIETGFIGDRCIVRLEKNHNLFSWMGKDGELRGYPMYLTNHCVNLLEALSKGIAIQYYTNPFL